jgi:hypothetical protein
MKIFILTIILLDPSGRLQEFKYPDLTAATCEDMRKMDVDAMVSNPRGYTFVSAECKPAAIQKHRKAA